MLVFLSCEMSIQKLVVLWLYFRKDRNCLVAMAFLDLPPDLRLPSRNAQVRLESLLAQHSQPATYSEQPAFKKKSRLLFTPTPSHGHCDSHVNIETPYENFLLAGRARGCCPRPSLPIQNNHPDVPLRLGYAVQLMKHLDDNLHFGFLLGCMGIV